MYQIDFNKKAHVHLIGIGGISMSGLAEILKTLPAEDTEFRPFYLELYKEMSERLAGLQGKDGYWHASLLDPDSYPSPETSATGFIVYGLAYGINLDRLVLRRPHRSLRRPHLPAFAAGRAVDSHRVRQHRTIASARFGGYFPPILRRCLKKSALPGRLFLCVFTIYSSKMCAGMA